MTEVRVAPGDLAGLDALEVDALALPLFEVRAQPRAVAGYADWRLSGRIARLLHNRKFTGAAGEALLMPTLGRIGASRLFLLGLGAPAQARAIDFSDAVRVLAEAGARNLAFGSPERREAVEHAALAQRFVSALGSRKSDFDSLTLLDPDGSLAEASGPVASAVKSAGLKWGG